MQLDARKLKILQAIIDEYVMSASPVGSRSVSKNPEFNLSSATIRNEMADLEEMGFLEQPHTSAGRIPSDKAYRLYVDSIMNRAQISRDEIRKIRTHFSSKISEVDDILKQTAVAISSVTNYTALVLAPELECDTLRHIQLVPLVPGKALMVVVTGTGFAKDAVIHVPASVRTEELEQISRFLTGRLYGVRMDMVSDRITSELEAEMADRKAFLSNVADGIERKITPSRKRGSEEAALDTMSAESVDIFVPMVEISRSRSVARYGIRSESIDFSQSATLADSCETVGTNTV